ncbi:MAG TPA: hypothetical protein VN038_13205 [Dyadobacter sp.]|nr:hypothetical protein [Dyadobacter sp.]
MKVLPITTEGQFDELLEWVDRQFDDPPCIKTGTGAHLQVALELIKAYEDIHYPIDNSDH